MAKNLTVVYGVEETVQFGWDGNYRVEILSSNTYIVGGRYCKNNPKNKSHAKGKKSN